MAVTERDIPVDIKGKALLPYAPLPVLLLAVLLFRGSGTDPMYLLLWVTMTGFGYVAAYSDYHRHIVPNRLVLTMLGVWVLIVVPQLLLRTDKVLEMVLSGLFGFALSGVLLLLVYCVSRKGLGGGDVKFMAITGLYLGARGTMSALFYGSVLAALFSLILIMLKKINMKGSIPLIPFLYLGILATIILL